MTYPLVASRAYNRFAWVVRGNRQEPHGGLAITSNHLTGEKNSATRSRIIAPFFPVLPEGSYDKAAFAELLEVREAVSGCFPDLLKLGYHALAIKQLEDEFRQHLSAAHARTAKSLTIATYYAIEIVRLAKLETEVDIKQWVIDVLCPQCNESQAGLNCVADFAENLEVLESRALIGDWCKVQIESEKYGSCIAIHLPSVWKEFDREFSPAYNRSVLEQVLIERGAIKNQVAKFYADRDQTLAYKRQTLIAGSSEYQPKEPEKVARKCILIRQSDWEILFGTHPDPTPPPPDPTPPSYLSDAPVTSSYQKQVTTSNADAVSNTAVQNSVSYLVTSKNEDQELNQSDRDFPNGTIPNHSENVENRVTEVTAAPELAETVATSTVEPVTDQKLLTVTEGGDEVTALDRAVRIMCRVDSIGAYQKFYDRFQLCSPKAQQQVLDAFKRQAELNVQERFHKYSIEFEELQESAQTNPEESAKPTNSSKWVYVQLPGDSCETLVKVLSEKTGSLSVHVPGAGVKSIKSSNITRQSDYTGD